MKLIKVIKTKQNEIYASNWDLMAFGGLSKNKIRELSKGVFDNRLVFATLNRAEIIEDKHIKLTVELNNVNTLLLNDEMANNYSKILSSNSATHNFNFKSFDIFEKREDISGYEPTKIPKGTYSNIKYVYIILDVFEK